MEHKETKLCACGCGGAISTWKNGRSSAFLRGHHMRKRDHVAPPSEKRFCECGCGREIKPLPSGHMRRFIWNHHMKGTGYTLENRIDRMRSRWGKEPTFSPYIPNAIVNFDKHRGRWTTCISKKPGERRKEAPHANAVYRHHFGDIPDGWVVHHKDGKHHELTDDRPENLMLLPNEWNLRFFPVLAKGFGITEKAVTDTYTEIFDVEFSNKDLFKKLCASLLGKQWATCG